MFVSSNHRDLVSSLPFSEEKSKIYDLYSTNTNTNRYLRVGQHIQIHCCREYRIILTQYTAVSYSKRL